MPNVSNAQGFRPVRYLNGAPWNGQVSRYLIPASDANAMFIGDPVKLAGSAGAQASSANGIPTSGMPTCILATAAANALGAIVGFEPDPSRLDIIYRLASTARVALVADDPNIVYEVQEDSVGAALAVADVGENADLIAGAGSVSSGFSGYMLDSSTHATTLGLNLKILRLVLREDNEIGNFAKWEVLFNAHHWRTGVVGI